MSKSFEERLIESTNILKKHSNRVPVIISVADKSIITQPVKNKFLIPTSVTGGQLLMIIRSKMTLKIDESIYLFINKTLINPTHIMQVIYNEHKDKDGFLYITIATETTFG